MKKYSGTFLTLIAISILISSCSIEKRHYRSGYSVTWKNGYSSYTSDKKSESSIEISEDAKDIPNLYADEELLYSSSNEDNDDNNVLQSNENASVSDLKQSQIKNVLSGNDCDRIYLRNGKIIKSKKTELADSMVFYQPCDSSTAISRSIKKKDIKVIKYTNGKTSFFNNVSYLAEENIYNEDGIKEANASVNKNIQILK